MSDNKGDTSRVVNNPLLSASVTGLTFDDFSCAPLLLPAAPPIEPSPPPVLELNSSEKESSSAPNFDTDSDAFSEINLNAPADEDCTQPRIASFTSPLEETTNTPDNSILSQAASSFSQLPTVASTVFSTFSKAIRDFSPATTENEDGNDVGADASTTAFEPFLVAPQPDISNDDLNQLDQLARDPPKLYSPTEVATIPSIPSAVQSGSQNTYRLAAKRKTYAQFPGLSSNFQQAPVANIVNPPVPNLPPVQPLQSEFSTTQASIGGGDYFQSEPFNLQVNQTESASFGENPASNQKKEERRGLFSLSNVVAPVWQNLSELVGKATSSEAQTVPSSIQDSTFARVDSPGQISTSHYFQPANLYQDPVGQSNSILAPSAPPLSEFSKETEQVQIASPPPLYSPNFSPSSVPPPIPIQRASEPLQQPPTSGPGNNFRLQKGTRHYRAPLEISTNPAISSNFLQPSAGNSAVNVGGVYPTTAGASDTAASANITFFNPTATSLSGTPFQGPAPIQGQTASASNQFSASTLSNPQPGIFNFATSATNSSRADEYYSSTPIQSLTPSKDFTVQANQEESFSAKTTPIQDFFVASQANSRSEQFAQGPQSGQGTEPFLPVNENQNAFISADVRAEDGLTVATSIENSKPSELKIEELKLSVSTEKVPVSDKRTEEQVNLVPTYSTSATSPDLASHAPTAIFPPSIASIPKLDSSRDSFESSTTTNIETNSQVQHQEDLNKNLSTNANVQPFNLISYFAPQSTNTASLFAEPKADLNLNHTPSTIPQKTISQTDSVPTIQLTPTYFSEKQQFDNIKNNNPTAVIEPDPISFFDTFQQQQQRPSANSSTSNQTVDICNPNFDVKSEDETSFQIQNFFNNPPPSLNQSASELNYKLVGSELLRKTLAASVSTSRAISPQSNVVEPPSSACSEFSADSSAQNTLNLSKLTNVDIPDGLDPEDFDQEIMALLISNKSTPTTNTTYQPVVKHWFYKRKVDDKCVWTPFSFHDSALIEEHYNNEGASKVVAVEGGRYDVNINEKLRIPVFWSGEATEVRRCSWFYKAVDSRYVPYEEAVAEKLETEYEEACRTGEWHRKIPLPTGETVVFHGATVLVHFLQTQTSDSWGAASQTTSRPRIVKRDLEDFNIEAGESKQVDHLLFMVHGIGSVCDLKFRSVEEVVDEFRNIGIQLVQSHYKNSCDSGRVGRVEVLPVSWHSELHSEESGVDEKLKAITLESIPKLRNFANDTLLDVLFYTSPVFCQNIMDIVSSTMNKVYSKYCQRNPTFNGGVSLAGHSLGSLILFDLLCHQKPIENSDIQNSENPDQPITPLQIRAQTPADDSNMTSKQISYTIGPAGTGQPFINYPQLVFQPIKFFALGSPIGMFVTIRGIDRLGLEFRLPTCRGFYNIFHPYDPVAYRIEALVNPDLSTARPVLVPHHKGRKRMHLELKETMTRVGADIKQRLVDTFKNTFGTVYQLTGKKSRPDPNEIEREVDKVLEMQLKMENAPRSRADSTSTHSDVDTGDIDLPLGKLNEGQRIDYVLQEAPLEFFNEYLFALTSHVCYWESEDTILFIMKEIYTALGVQPDSQVPQQTMTIERPQSNSLSPDYDQSGTSGSVSH